MSDFADRVIAAARKLPRAVVLCGWSMGGLVALQAAQHLSPHSVVLLEARPPAEAQDPEPSVEIGEGLFASKPSRRRDGDNREEVVDGREAR
jgi:pimeloyl-ACP methyl ester carboxylesterase